MLFVPHGRCRLCGFLCFPPLRTVHATFIAHGAPSVTCHRLEAIAPATHYKCHHNFDLYFSAPIQLLIVLRQFTSIDARYISPFQQSYPSHIPLGACYGTDNFFDSLSYASPYLAASSTCIAAWTVSLYFAGSSDRNGHAHHGYFMDHRHIS